MSGAGTIAMALTLPFRDASSKPPADTEASIIALVCRTYPHAGNHLEAAVRLAVRASWAAAVHQEKNDG